MNSKLEMYILIIAFLIGSIISVPAQENKSKNLISWLKYVKE